MTAEAVASPITESLVGEHEKGTDLTIRVRVLEVDGEKFTDIREYVPSSETYGRGVLIPFDATKPLLKTLMDAARTG